MRIFGSIVEPATACLFGSVTDGSVRGKLLEA
jgi:hypothetical protein